MFAFIKNLDLDATFFICPLNVINDSLNNCINTFFIIDLTLFLSLPLSIF